jgi:predicted permease
MFVLHVDLWDLTISLIHYRLRLFRVWLILWIKISTGIKYTRIQLNKLCHEGYSISLFFHSICTLDNTNYRLGLMIRWSYGYRYLLAPDFKSDMESQDSSQESPVRRQTVESDENTPLIRFDGQSASDYSRRTLHSYFPSEHDHSTIGPPPIIASNPLLRTDEDVNLISFPTARVCPLKTWPKLIPRFLSIALREFLEFMNMPLWAMLLAVLIALFPNLQHYLFFEENGFIRGSIIYAIHSCGDVSIPLILVILGANIANDDPPALEDSQTNPIVDRKWSLTQRQRGLILAVVIRMFIVPVYPIMLCCVDYSLSFVP